MFSSRGQLKRRTGNFGTSRFEYLQELVTEFQSTADAGAKEQVLANLANFAYDPVNYNWLLQLNVVELFLDMLTEDDMNLVKFALGGLCNCCCDPGIQQSILSNEGLPLILQCMESADQGVIISALTILYFLPSKATASYLKASDTIEVLKKLVMSNNAQLSNLSTIIMEDKCSKQI